MPDEITASRRANEYRERTTFHADDGSVAVPKSSVDAPCKGTAATSGVLTPEVNGTSHKTSSNDLRARIDAELAALRENSQLRALDLPRGLNLCSNDYLGLAYDPRLKQALLDAVFAASRIASTGSRLLSGNSRDWEEIESEFADFVSFDSALYFNSGYAANIGLLSSIAQPNDIIFSDALNHASLIDGIRLSRARKIIYPHRDMQFLENALHENASSPAAKIIVTESVFSMEGDIAPLEALANLAAAHNAFLIVDEAHALGVCGHEGRGLIAALPNRSRVLAAIYPCGKALASCGAFVAGSAALKEFLVNNARSFIFSTANPPYIAHQIRAALALARAAEDRRAHLRKISRALHSALSAAGFSCGDGDTPIVPLILGSNEAALRVAAELQSAGFAVKAIRPPTVPAGSARIRISLTSNVSLDDVHRLAHAISAAAAHVRVTQAATFAHA